MATRKKLQFEDSRWFVLNADGYYGHCGVTGTGYATRDAAVKAAEESVRDGSDVLILAQAIGKFRVHVEVEEVSL